MNSEEVARSYREEIFRGQCLVERLVRRRMIEICNELKGSGLSNEEVFKTSHQAASKDPVAQWLNMVEMENA